MYRLNRRKPLFCQMFSFRLKCFKNSLIDMHWALSSALDIQSISELWNFCIQTFSQILRMIQSLESWYVQCTYNYKIERKTLLSAHFLVLQLDLFISFLLAAVIFWIHTITIILCLYPPTIIQKYLFVFPWRHYRITEKKVIVKRCYSRFSLLIEVKFSLSAIL